MASNNPYRLISYHDTLEIFLKIKKYNITPISDIFKSNVCLTSIPENLFGNISDNNPTPNNKPTNTKKEKKNIIKIILNYVIKIFKKENKKCIHCGNPLVEIGTMNIDHKYILYKCTSCDDRTKIKK